jgi:hypothetical protein
MSESDKIKTSIQQVTSTPPGERVNVPPFAGEVHKMQTIPLTECKHGYLYRISSRNLAFGVFNENSQGFVGIREKFGNRYLFTEFHWDTGAPFGTVHPKELLEECPITDLASSHTEERDGTKWAITNQPLFDWLQEKEAQYRCS